MHFRPPVEYLDSQFLSIVAGGISASILALQRHLSPNVGKSRAVLQPDEVGDDRPEQNLQYPSTHAFWVARVASCVLLTITSIATAALPGLNPQSTPQLKLPHYMEPVVFTYATILAFNSRTPSRRSERVLVHLELLILLTFWVYAYRDLWPLSTFDRSPLDASVRGLLWVKIFILFFSGIILPLSRPQDVYDVDHNRIITGLTQEQTASRWSRITYSFMSPLIGFAARVPSLPYSKIPPLAEYHRARSLMNKSFPSLDPFAGGQRRYLFWGMLSVFKWEYTALAFLQIAQSAFAYVSPLGINKLLQYFETGGEGITIRPWFWIAWLFLGPTMRAILSQFYTYISSRVMVQLEAILLQLIFAHSLRLRMDTEDSNPTSGNKKYLTGRINNLATSDVSNITAVNEFWIVVLFAPIQIAFSIIFLYAILSWSAIIGLVVMVVCFPLPGYLTSKMRGLQQSRMKQMDVRVQKVTEALSVLRMIKMFGWEERVKTQIDEARQKELALLLKTKLTELITANLNYLIPLLTMISTYASYTLLLRQQLTASTVFASIAIFEIQRLHLRSIVTSIPNLVNGKVSLDRLDDFLKNSETLDEFLEPQSPETPSGSLWNESDHVSLEEPPLGFRDAEFSWSPNAISGFKLQIKGSLTFAPGINLIIGPTGSGKTSLLMALLGEMHFRRMGPTSMFSLPRKNGVAYAPQKSWVQNETIRENILFGAPMDKDRYQKVLHQCALLPDLALYEAGDMTEVGEKGLTLSGGQKARVTLARAVYSSAQILLLDDTLAALDVHTSTWIVDNCFHGDLMVGRTLLVVSHDLARFAPISEYVVQLDLAGNIRHGPTQTLIDMDAIGRRTPPIERDSQQLVQITSVEEKLGHSKPPNVVGKLIVQEEVQEGNIGRSAFKLYFSALSRFPILFWLVVASAIILNEIIIASQYWLLGYWSSQYETHDPSEVSVPYYLSIYALLLLFSVSCYSLCYTAFTFGSARASRLLHQKLMNTVFGTTMRWLDQTPTSRIITRATQDMKTIDGSLSFWIRRLLEVTVAMGVKFMGIIYFSPIFSIPSICVATLGFRIGQAYMRTQLSVKRHMSNARSPVLGHFAAAVSGIVCIRAYGAQAQFLERSLQHIDHYSRPAFTFYNLNRWVAIRSEALGGAFTAALGAYVMYSSRSNPSASDTGFSLTMAVGFSSLILIGVRILNNVELNGNSLERLLQHFDIEQEEANRQERKPPAAWPTSGQLHAENLTARYSEDGPEVLHGLSFRIEPGEHIGVVGRTGSGKSSLTLSLLRCIPTGGRVFYDGLLTSAVNLDALRSNITIIPQDPELMSGTLRDNLDPFDEHDDAILHEALRSAGLYSLQDGEGNGANITLDTPISSGGSNLSVGQRQIIALSRALVRGSKLLILDEATSSIDHQTDAVIQSMLRHELSGVTLITVAHRLQTIMDFDRIMVLDAGQIVEFDTPRGLLKNPNGFLRALVDESPNKDVLYAMAENS